MKLALLILLAILPVAALATQTGQESAGDAGQEAVTDTTQVKSAVPAQAQDAVIDDPIDPLPVSKKKCLAVDKHGFCSQWATN
ncbi:MAG TPA: hypothetical protein VJS30_06880 [Paraburkholderia sp.]|nr:hypothetical protein [Paraburkholderia sp.]